jgi:hypothetical protein
VFLVVVFCARSRRRMDWMHINMIINKDERIVIVCVAYAWQAGVQCVLQERWLVSLHNKIRTVQYSTVSFA